MSYIITVWGRASSMKKITTLRMMTLSPPIPHVNKCTKYEYFNSILYTLLQQNFTNKEVFFVQL